MAWIELKLQTQSDLAELLSSILEAHGALAVTTQDAGNQPIFEPDPGIIAIWNDVYITGLFDEAADIKKLMTRIIDEFPEIKYSQITLEEQEWERTWMQDFLPMQFGERLWIIPSYEAQDSPFQIILDPGLAFGTGKHPTTALCLRWLDQNIKGQEIILDYGCGSGILGIAALKLGAQKVFAVDHDPQAISATTANAVRNNIKDSELVTLYPAEVMTTLKVDILIANILANPIVQLSKQFASHLNSGGILVLSGILQEQVTRVLEAYSTTFEQLQVDQEEEWVRIVGLKK